MKVLVLNSGSSSIKYRLFDGDRTVARGVVERIGEHGSVAADHVAAVRRVTEKLGLGNGDDRLDAIGHRVVHGGLRFTEPTLIDDKVVAEVEALVPLAHSTTRLTSPESPPPGSCGRKCPSGCLRYGVPPHPTAGRGDLRHRRGGGAAIRDPPLRVPRHLPRVRLPADRCPARAASKRSTSSRCTWATAPAPPPSPVVAASPPRWAHPLEGLVMGTRSGDIDPAIIFHLRRTAGMSVDDLDDLLNRRSGLRGLAGRNDMREILAARATGDPAAALALDVYCHASRVTSARTMRCSAEWTRSPSPLVSVNMRRHRAAACEGLERLGIAVTRGATMPGLGERLFSPDDADVAVWASHRPAARNRHPDPGAPVAVLTSARRVALLPVRIPGRLSGR